jgi:hypothetical protein
MPRLNGKVAEVLNRVRPLTLEMIRRLAAGRVSSITTRKRGRCNFSAGASPLDRPENLTLTLFVLTLFVLSMKESP